MDWNSSSRGWFDERLVPAPFAGFRVIRRLSAKLVPGPAFLFVPLLAGLHRAICPKPARAGSGTSTQALSGSWRSAGKVGGRPAWHRKTGLGSRSRRHGAATDTLYGSAVLHPESDFCDQNRSKARSGRREGRAHFLGRR